MLLDPQYFHRQVRHVRLPGRDQDASFSVRLQVPRVLGHQPVGEFESLPRISRLDGHRAPVVREVQQRRARRVDARQPTRHRLAHGEAEALAHGGKGERASALVQFPHLRLRQVPAVEDHVALLDDLGVGGGGLQVQLHVRPVLECAPGPQHELIALTVVRRADPQHPEPLGSQADNPPGPVGLHVNPLGRVFHGHGHVSLEHRHQESRGHQHVVRARKRLALPPGQDVKLPRRPEDVEPAPHRPECVGRAVMHGDPRPRVYLHARRFEGPPAVPVPVRESVLIPGALDVRCPGYAHCAGSPRTLRIASMSARIDSRSIRIAASGDAGHPPGNISHLSRASGSRLHGLADRPTP